MSSALGKSLEEDANELIQEKSIFGYTATETILSEFVIKDYLLDNKLDIILQRMNQVSQLRLESTLAEKSSYDAQLAELFQEYFENIDIHKQKLNYCIKVVEQDSKDGVFDYRAVKLRKMRRDEESNAASLYMR